MRRGENMLVRDETSSAKWFVKTFLDQSNLPGEFIADDFYATDDPLIGLFLE
jgi:hypothetical protein